MTLGLNKFQSSRPRPGASEPARAAPHAGAGEMGRAEGRNTRRVPDPEHIAVTVMAKPDAFWRNQDVVRPGLHKEFETTAYLDDMSEAFVQRLTSAQLEALKAEAGRRNRTLTYSTMALVLQLMRNVREAEARRGCQISFKEMMQDWSADHQQLITDQKGGTCFTLASNLHAAVAAEHHVQSFVVVADRAPANMANWSDYFQLGGKIHLEDVAQHCGGIGHADVAIPYSRHGGERRVLLLPTGQPDGVEPEDFELDQFFERKMTSGRVLSDADALAVRCMWGRSRVAMMAPQSRRVFGIDFVKDLMYVNSEAMQVLRAEGAMNPSGGAPGLVEQQYDLSRLQKTASPMGKGRSDAWRECLFFLKGVREVFALSEPNMMDLVYLINRRYDFLNDVVHPMGRVLRDTRNVRDEALRAAEDVRSISRLRGGGSADLLLDDMRVKLGHAQNAVIRCDMAEAQQCYRQAATTARSAKMLLSLGQTQSELP